MGQIESIRKPLLPSDLGRSLAAMMLDFWPDAIVNADHQMLCSDMSIDVGPLVKDVSDLQVIVQFDDDPETGNRYVELTRQEIRDLDDIRAGRKVLVWAPPKTPPLPPPGDAPDVGAADYRGEPKAERYHAPLGGYVCDVSQNEVDLVAIIRRDLLEFLSTRPHLSHVEMAVSEDHSATFRMLFNETCQPDNNGLTEVLRVVLEPHWVMER